MKLVLILIISITAAFAQNTDQNILHAEEMVTKSSQKAKRKARGLKRILNRLTHDFQTEKMVKTSERKERRKFRVIRFLEKIKNSIGPVDVKSVESENPNKLLFVVTGKTKHFKVHSAKFAVGDILEGLNWATSGENITVSELEEGKYSLEVDISSVEIGEHKLVMNIKYTLGRRQRLKLTRISKSIFEKIQTETAHAELVEVSANPQNSRIGFDMGSSYSDIGNILSYTVDTIKNGEVIATQTLDPLVSGTYFTQSFHMEGIYQVKLTVIDESGDTDSTLSREYEVISPAPIVELAVTQNEEYKDIFEFDLSGTKMESGAIDYIYLYFARSLEETGGAYEELDFKFISGQDFRDSQDFKFNYKTTARGNVFVGAFVVSTDGVSNFFDIYGLNIPETPKESIFLDLSHNFKRDGYPYTQVYAFPAPIDEAQFKQFNIKITDASENTTNLIQDYTDSGSGFFHVYVDTKKSGAFDVEITLETIDGLLSLPFNTSLTVDEVDFGVATLDLNLYFSDESVNTFVNWDVNIENSNPGNFGYFTDFYCDFKDKEDSYNNFRVENEGTQNYWIEIPRGNYEVDCFGRTSVGLISSNELKFQIDARNKAPSIQNVQSSLTDQNFLTYSINIDAIDEDGFIAKVLVKEVYSNGVSNEYEADNFISVNAQGLVGGDGFVDIELIAIDGEGAQSEPYNLRIDFENLAPSFEIVATLLDENTKEYQFNFQMSDDGYVERQIFTATAPTGNVYSYDAFNLVEQFLSEAPGIWTIQVEGIDNLGKSTIKSIQVEVENKAPEVLALNIYPVNENERLFEIIPDVVDYDGYFIADELIITFPSGSTIQGNPGTGPSQWNLNEPGNYVISYRAQDNAGDWSEVFTINYSVINKAPVAVFEIAQVSQDRWFVVTESSYDEDGFIIEHRFEFNGPQGEYVTRSESGSFDIQLVSPGIWNIGYDVKDNDQEWSAKVSSGIEVINQAPTIELTYELIDEDTNTYRFDVTYSDDFGDMQMFLKTTAPDGIVSEIETVFPVERTLAAPGEWEVVGRIVDQDGSEATETVLILVEEDPLFDRFYFNTSFPQVGKLLQIQVPQPEGRSFSYRWKINNQVQVTTTNFLSFTPQHTGSILVSLEASDSVEIFNVEETIYLNPAKSPTIEGLDEIDLLSGNIATASYQYSPDLNGLRLELVSNSPAVQLDENGEITVDSSKGHVSPDFIISLIDDVGNLYAEKQVSINLLNPTIVGLGVKGSELSEINISNENSLLNGAKINFGTSVVLKEEIQVLEFEKSANLVYLYIQDEGGSLVDGYSLENIPSGIKIGHRLNNTSFAFHSDSQSVTNTYASLEIPEITTRHCPNELAMIANEQGVSEYQRFLNLNPVRKSIYRDRVNVYVHYNYKYSEVKQKFDSVFKLYPDHPALNGSIEFVITDYLAEEGVEIDSVMSVWEDYPNVIFISGKLLLGDTDNAIAGLSVDQITTMLFHEVAHVNQAQAQKCYRAFPFLYPSNQIRKLKESHAEYAMLKAMDDLNPSFIGKYLSASKLDWGPYLAHFAKMNYANNYLTKGYTQRTFNLPERDDESSNYFRIEERDSNGLGGADGNDIYRFAALFEEFDWFYLHTRAVELAIPDIFIEDTAQLLLETYGVQSYEKRMSDLLFTNFAPEAADVETNKGSMNLAIELSYSKPGESLEHIASKRGDDGVEVRNLSYVSPSPQTEGWIINEIMPKRSSFRRFINLDEVSSFSAVDILSIFVTEENLEAVCKPRVYLRGRNGFGYIELVPRKGLSEDYTLEQIINNFTTVTDSGKFVDIIAINSCDRSVDLSIFIGRGTIADCNLDGINDDPAYITTEGGFFEIGTPIAEGATIAGGARVCGNSRILNNNTYIDGERVLLNDVFIDEKCSHVLISSTGSLSAFLEDPQKSNFLELFNMQICTNFGAGGGIVIDSSKSLKRISLYNSVIGSSVHIDETDMNNAVISGDGFVTLNNSFVYDSNVKGANYISDSVLNRINVNAPINPFTLNDSSQIVNSLQGTAMYSVAEGRKSISGYNLIQGPVLTNVSIAATLPLKNRVNGFVVLNHIRASSSGTRIDGIQTVNATVDDCTLNGRADEVYQSSVDWSIWRVDASGYYKIDHPLGRPEFRTRVHNQRTISNIGEYEFEPYGPMQGEIE